jgi:membrane protein
VVATVTGVATLLLGATGVFGELQDSLNSIWEVEPKSDQGIWGTIKKRFFSFTMVLGTGFLLLVSLVVSAAIAAFADKLEHSIPGFSLISRVLSFAVGLLVTTLVFALIFKVIPDARVAWRDVWVGALVTALLFSFGRFALGEYLGRSAFASSYGAVASLVIVLFWVYYSAQIMFLGAEFTQVHARARGADIQPALGARIVDRASEPAPDAVPDRASACAPTRTGKRLALAGLLTGFLLARRRSQQH